MVSYHSNEHTSAVCNLTLYHQSHDHANPIVQIPESQIYNLLEWLHAHKCCQQTETKVHEFMMQIKKCRTEMPEKKLLLTTQVQTVISSLTMKSSYNLLYEWVHNCTTAVCNLTLYHQSNIMQIYKCRCQKLQSQISNLLEWLWANKQT